MPLLSVFQFLGRMRKSGVLTVRLVGETMTFEFENGSVQSCLSSTMARGERLGDLLVESKACTREALSRFIARFGKTAKHQVGELIVREGLVTNGQVLEALELQVRRRFARACKTPEATYEFHDGQPRRSDGRVRITPAELAHQANRIPTA
jgi:hypothetical protein